MTRGLTAERVIRLRRDVRAGRISARDLSKAWGVGYSAILDALHGRTWRELPSAEELDPTTAARWRDVPGWEGLYMVSDEGLVRSCRSGRLLRRWVSNVGYPMVTLSKDGQDCGRTVHRLVALAFIGPCPDGMEVRHLDDNKLNCRAENLVYGTRSENLADRVDNDRHNRGERNGLSKLTEEKVREARRLVAAGSRGTLSRLAREHGVSRVTLRNAVLGKTWSWVS